MVAGEGGVGRLSHWASALGLKDYMLGGKLSPKAYPVGNVTSWLNFERREPRCLAHGGCSSRHCSRSQLAASDSWLADRGKV